MSIFLDPETVPATWPSPESGRQGSHRDVPKSERTKSPAGRTGPFERLVQIGRSNEALFASSRELARRIDETRRRLAGEGGDTRLARAYLDRLQDRRSACVAALRANRIEALQLLGLDAASRPVSGIEAA